jgi:hypothetical protein
MLVALALPARQGGSNVAERIDNYVMTPHAVEEMRRRGVPEVVVVQVLAAPEQRALVRPGRVVCQPKVAFDVPGKLYLVRVFVDVNRQPAEVVTVYRTSRIDRYWSDQP